MKRIVLAFAVVVAAAGCSAKADFEKICNAEQLSGAASEADPATKATKIAQWITANVHSSDANNAMRALASVNPDDKGRLLKQAFMSMPGVRRSPLLVGVK